MVPLGVTVPTVVKFPLASSFILFIPPVAKNIVPLDSVIVQLPRSTEVAVIPKALISD